MSHLLPPPSLAQIARLPPSMPKSQSPANIDLYTEELWKSCAGPLVSVPKVGARVWYFPQGHLEQVAASTGPSQIGGLHRQDHHNEMIPQYNLPSQILCRVMNLSLSAEPETDEVFAQLTLLPEPDDDLDLIENKEPSESPRRSVGLFTKILTASDTSTHGGFSVLRKHAEDCLPPLDMSQDIPSQELVARDLHGQDWKFRHIYRGHPRRHLLTTGWSYFVSQKKLIAGDAVVFLRGENGELRVGIRRTKRQQPPQPSNVLTSHSMQMGVVATASHAILTRTMFSVYFKPRASPFSFIVPIEKLAKASRTSMSVGMRFKMNFEGEDASKKSYVGTITGIDDLNSICWPNSKWRSLRVDWDEKTNNEQQDRVSPWEIELSAAYSNSSSNNNNSSLKNKRLRPTLTSDSAGCNTSTQFPPLQPSISQSYQGVNMVCDEDFLTSHHQIWSQRSEQGGYMKSLERLDMAPRANSDSQSHPHTCQNGNSLHRQHHEGMMDPGAWPLMNNMLPSGHSSALAGTMPATILDNSQLLMPFSSWEFHQKSEKPDVSDNGCKLFGFSLVEPPKSTKLSGGISEDSNAIMKVPLASQASSYIAEDKSASSEVENSENTSLKLLKEFSHSNAPVRSCTKVIKKGSMVGRGVDLSKFDNYKKLIEELEVMFHIEGELSNPDKGWQVAYTDDEGDTMQVGDDPWIEFCNMVRKIHIFSPEEVHAARVSPSRTQCSKDKQRCGRECPEDEMDLSTSLPLPG